MPPPAKPVNPSSILHRRPAYAVNSPAVLCHQCYRLNDVARSDTPLLSTIRRDIATVALNTTLFRIQTAGLAPDAAAEIFVFRLAERGGSPATASERMAARQLEITKRQFGELSAERSERLRYVDSQRTILSMLPILDRDAEAWVGWRARMRVDLHSEFYSVTFILDRASRAPSGAREAPTDVDGNAPNPASLPATSAQSLQYVRDWYREIWTRFFALLDSAGHDTRFPADKFSECRGLVLETEARIGEDQPGQAQGAHDPIVDLLRMQQRLDERKKRMFEWLNRRLDLVREVLQFDRLYRQMDQDANCVLCTVLEGRGIFASSLGQVQADAGGSNRAGALDDAAASSEPDRYLVLHDGIPRFQLGRLLRRLHVLDELRCAAVFDFGHLINASERIRTLGNEIDRHLHTEEPRRDKSALSRESLAGIQGELNELTAIAVDGGLLYRINRSRYYAQDFKLRMSDMLFQPIDGWEPYDIFMHRNLYPILDHIDSIGQRFDALAARVERLTNARNVEELVTVESEIVYIQSIGEIIGWTAFAYYFSQILSKVLHPICKSVPCLSPPDCAWLADHDNATSVSVGLAIATALLLGVGFRNRWFGGLFKRIRGRFSARSNNEA